MPNARPSLDTLVCEAVEIADADARAAYLDRACGDDHALRRQAAALVVAHFQAGSFLEQPACPPGCTAPHTPAPGEADPAQPPERPGTYIGPYKLLERIGEGGMGAVYVAEQAKPVRRRVAVKVIKPGMDSKEVVARFEAERQALALMDHPHIAKVLDAGTTQGGRPYFVMELVRGLSITEYCDQARLPAERLLRLFAQVCRAVQHAHQKGVIHRDLKPSNILVTLHDGEPVPKVIDFGVAKALNQRLTDKTVYTRLAQLVGTPLYMSPEQAELSALDVDTRSDLYSLGVLLYELLTGTTPFDPEAFRKAGFDEMRRMIREDEPPRPSQRVSTLGAQARSTLSARRGLDDRQLRRLLHGDLDWVVMKALEKDRNRRYESAGAFADDVERYLADEPVLARPPSAWYRARKFGRRNRAGLLTTATILTAGLTLAASAGWWVWERGVRRVAVEQRVAEALAAARAGLAAGDLTLARQRLGEADGHLGPERDRLPGPTAAIDAVRQEIADRQSDADRLRQFLKLSSEAQDKMAFNQDLGGRLLADKALALYEVLTAPEWLARIDRSSLTPSQKVQLREAVYVALVSLADYHVRGGSKKETQDVGRSMDLLRKAEAFHPPTRAFYFVRGTCHSRRGDAAAAKGDWERQRQTPARTAWDHFLPGHTAGWEGKLDDAIQAYRAALSIQPDHYNALFYLAHRLRDVKKEYAEAVGLFTGCVALKPEHMFAYENRSEAYQKLGRWEAAEADLATALAVAPDDNDRRFMHERRRDFYHARGQEKKGRDEHAKATALMEKDVETKKAAHGPNHPDTLMAMDVLGVAYARGGRLAEAIQLHEAALARRTETLGPDHADTALSMHNLAVACHDSGQSGRAISLFESVLARSTKVHGPNNAHTLDAMTQLAVSLRSAGRPEEAIPLLERVRDARRANLGADHTDTLDAMHGLAHAYHEAGRVTDAVPLFRRTFTAAAASFGASHPATLKQMGCFAVACQESGALDEADRLFRDLLTRRMAKDGPKSADTAGVQAALGLNLLLQKQFTKAEPMLRECVATREQLMPKNWLYYNAQSMHGEALLGQGKNAEAEPILLKGYEGMKQREADIPASTKKRLREAAERLVRLCEATGRVEQAREWRAKLPPVSPSPRKRSP
ncbi:MAG: serine/threonine-protein kinase [Gemmataceae bacterium]